MKRFLILPVLALFLLIPTSALAWEAKVIMVSDGDSVTVEDVQGRKDRVRLWGLDAPELQQRYGKQAKKALEDAVLNHVVEIQEVARDRYARLLAIIVVGSEDTALNVNEYMVRSGNAWARGSNRWKNDEVHAREERAGQPAFSFA